MTDEEKAAPLSTVFENVHRKYKGQTLDAKSMSDYQLVDFMNDVLPGYDTEKVYLSDIRKLITWYNILVVQVPELFEQPTEEQAAEEQPAEEKESE